MSKLYSYLIPKTFNSSDLEQNEIGVVQEYISAVSNTLYAAIVPEKPAVLAEERIFVYVPKVTPSTPGIAQFALNQFIIVNGQVFLRDTYIQSIAESDSNSGMTVYNSIEEAQAANILDGQYVLIKI
jgi:hypothetical protein